MDAKLVAQVKATLIENEGEMPCMYLDTLGISTCGVGHALFAVEGALGLPWILRWNGKAATENDIREEYAAVRRMPTGMLPTYYSARADLALSAAAIEELLAADLERIERDLAAELPEFASYPDQAQAGLLDMAFQLGVQGLMEKFPRLIAAANAGDWAAAAVESHRVGIATFRNVATRNLFWAANDRTAPRVAAG